MNITIIQILFVGVGGFIGSTLRYIIALFSMKLWGDGFPFSTLIVNVVGSFLIGIIMGLDAEKGIVPPNIRLLLVTGILGGFTTFSAFSYETISLFDGGRILAGMMNIIITVILGLVAVYIGKTGIRLLLT